MERRDCFRQSERKSKCARASSSRVKSAERAHLLIHSVFAACGEGGGEEERKKERRKEF